MSTEQVGTIPRWTVGDRLRKARESRGLDQCPFAEMLGVSRGTVSNYERGTTERYKPIVLKAWSVATGISVEWLESGTEPFGSPDPGTTQGAGDALQRLTASKRSRRGAPRSTATPQYLMAAA